MTRTTNARVAGITFLVYIAAGIGSTVLLGRATRGEETAAKLASIAAHATDVRLAIVLALLGCFAALVLGVTLYGITRDEDPELAMLALACRVVEGVLGASNFRMPALLRLATGGAGAGAPDAATTNALGAFLLMPGAGTAIGATFFAVGSTLFAYLLLRGRMIPVLLAWLGVLASALLVVTLPLQLTALLQGPATWYMWMPMLVFEVVLALWLIVKGVAAPAER
jgi:uncharacterized protein DUF4386